MMKIEDIVDDIVLLILNDPEPFKPLGLNQNTLYTRIKGYDEYGLWIEHPGLKVPRMPLPTEAETKETQRKPTFQTVPATVLLPWGFINSVVHFPDVEGFDFPSPFEQHIGFEIES